MAALKWWNRGLTDSGLTLNLNGLPEDKEFKEVGLSSNNLEHFPNLNHYKQFEHVEFLNLSENSIASVDTEQLPHHIKVLEMNDNQVRDIADFTQCHQLERLGFHNNRIESFNSVKLPPNIKVLHLEKNLLTEITDMSQCHRLVRLFLSDNQITEIDPSKLPFSIERLDMSNNKLTEVRDFSHHKQLFRLDLRGNRIMKIYNVNKDMSSWIIDTFDENFFETEDGYNHLKASNFNITDLIQPPPQVFQRGLKSVQTYFKDMALSKRVRHSRKRYVFCEIMLNDVEISEHFCQF